MIQLYNGDCLELMKNIPDGSVDLTVTSPPYDNLRTYSENIDQWNFEKFKEIAKEYRVNCDFMGFLEYGEMMATLMKCDVAVNPIVGKSVSSIINKVSDYAMAGVPVVNTQNSEEYRNLIDEYKCGINCRNDDVNDIANAIRRLYNDEELRKDMGKNSQKLGVERFDRSKTYPEIFEIIERLF